MDHNGGVKAAQRDAEPPVAGGPPAKTPIAQGPVAQRPVAQETSAQPSIAQPPIVHPATTHSATTHPPTAQLPTPQPTGGKRSTEHWLVLAAAIATLGLLVAFAIWIEPDPRGFGTHEKLGLPACKMMEWWGIPCPGCGVTTSVDLAARGRFLDSIRNQPFGFVVALLLPAGALWAIVGHFRGRDLYRDLYDLRIGRWGIVLGLLLAAAWVYKIVMVRRGMV